MAVDFVVLGRLPDVEPALGPTLGLLAYDMRVVLALGNFAFCSAVAAVWSILVRKSSARPAMSVNHDMPSVCCWYQKRGVLVLPQRPLGPKPTEYYIHDRHSVQNACR
uniref:Putative muscle myosin heavy chain n=1 Tax=Ixodes ricinus TaxID=34613 RepID=A0A0K8RCU8_IXORI